MQLHSDVGAGELCHSATFEPLQDAPEPRFSSLLAKFKSQKFHTGVVCHGIS
jgi:hypothetical protein